MANLATLATLAARCAALHARVEELVAIFEYFPSSVRSELFAWLPAVRLRELELVWERVHGASDAAAGAGWLFESESQCAWSARWEAAASAPGAVRGSSVHLGDPAGASTASDGQRDFRQLFWERHVRALLKVRTNALDSSSDKSDRAASSGLNEAAPASPTAAVATASGDEHGDLDAHLFADVVRSLRVHGREVRALNMPLIASLRQLRRLEVHHPEQQRTCWPSLLELLTSIPTLRELGFFHGKLTDVQIAQVRRTLRDEQCGVTAVELVSVKLRPKGFREIVALVSELQTLEQFRLTNSVTDMDNRALLDAAIRAPSLKTLALEHNDLEDDAFQGLATVLRPIALRHLRLGNNALAASTLGAISNASLDGFLSLERLELTNNTEVCDTGVHALTPMLASGLGDGAALAGLQHLDLRNCEFGLEGVMNLLLALGANRSLTHLNISQNFFGTSFGDILADFLLTNDTLRALHADYVGLAEQGCTKRLSMALRQNRSLEVVSLAANRLRDVGACAVLLPIVERGRDKPFARVNLGGNLLTRNGLVGMARIFERGEAASGLGEHDDDEGRQRGYDHRQKRRRLSSDNSHGHHPNTPDSAHCSERVASETKPVIGELSLLNNDFKGDSADALAILRAHVGHVSSNEWTGKRNVYDDEV